MHGHFKRVKSVVQYRRTVLNELERHAGKIETLLAGRNQHFTTVVLATKRLNAVNGGAFIVQEIQLVRAGLNHAEIGGVGCVDHRCAQRQGVVVTPLRGCFKRQGDFFRASVELSISVFNDLADGEIEFW